MPATIATIIRKAKNLDLPFTILAVSFFVTFTASRILDKEKQKNTHRAEIAAGWNNAALLCNGLVIEAKDIGADARPDYRSRILSGACIPQGPG